MRSIIGMTIKNCLELSKRQARTVLFSNFKFPPKDENTLMLFQLKLMKGLVYEVSQHLLEHFSSRIWPKIKKEVFQSMRSKRKSVTQMADKTIVGKKLYRPNIVVVAASFM